MGGLVTSKAIGGPLDGVKLAASADWDGRLERQSDGKYRLVNGAWRWTTISEIKCGVTIHRWPRGGIRYGAPCVCGLRFARYHNKEKSP